MTSLGNWSLSACNVEIRTCADPIKGKGAFAKLPLKKGKTVGVYLGEKLNQEQYALRHFGDAATTAAEVAHMKERSERLLLLDEGAPMGGIDNHGSYVFELFPSRVRLPSDRVAYLDAEDPNRSSWCRYINCAPATSTECNLVARVNAHRGLVWFEASRDIQENEELQFDYANGGASSVHRLLFKDAGI